MAILGTIIKRSLQLRKRLPKRKSSKDAVKMQRKTLRKLLKKARNTEFGHTYDFKAILASHQPERLFQKLVPIFDYNSLYENWWFKTLQGQANVCWPGKIKYFALSSGTSGAASKHIPVTTSALKSMRKTSIRQILTLTQYPLPQSFFEKGVLVVGGSSDLENMGAYYQGDLSGINQAKMPFYTQPFYKPGRKIARYRDWNTKIDEIVKNAPQWDIGVITGVPAWNQIILERIIETYKLKHIHEMWPNLSVFIYGGVSIAPYKKSFERLLGKPIHYLETYLASEGFIAYQSNEQSDAMELVLNNGLFMEFVPFTSANFNDDGTLKENPEALLINQVQINQEYALLISTNAGAWRYLIGDTIRFTNSKRNEIVITGRTKHFLSLCGEHLSTDNMNQAIDRLAETLQIEIPEFTVAGVKVGSLFGHEWYLGTPHPIQFDHVEVLLDEILKKLNDDYAVERAHALKQIRVHIVPLTLFYAWMEQKGKMGGQHKFPRVLNAEQLADWKQFIQKHPQ